MAIAIIAGGVGRDEIVSDAAALAGRLGLGPVAVLGHSLGGITAYQLAARHPGLVSALIIEDVGPVMRRHLFRPGRARPVHAHALRELQAIIEATLPGQWCLASQAADALREMKHRGHRAGP